MAGYKELFDGFYLFEGEAQIRGHRDFIWTDDGPISSLPTVHVDSMIDENNNPIRACRCRHIETFYDPQRADEPIKRAVYDTESRTRTRASTVQQKFQFSAGTEALTINDTSGYWTFATGGNAVTAPIPKDNGLHQLIFSRNEMSESAFLAFMALCRDNQHTINNAEFLFGWPAGTVKFMGGTGERYWNQDGKTVYAAQIEFLARYIKDDHGSPTTDSWLYQWNDCAAAGAGWDKPKDSSNNYLYAKADHTVFFT